MVVKELDAGPTHGEFMEMLPSLGGHDRILSAVTGRARRWFPRTVPLPVFVVPVLRVPAGRDAATSVTREQHLPKVRLMMCCTSTPLDPRREGSQAVIV